LETQVEQSLGTCGWAARAAAIVIDPELEAWVWSDSPHVDRILGWERKSPDLREWLRSRGLLEQDATKPRCPKKAMAAAIWRTRKARSSSLYAQLADRVSLDRCSDPAFLKLKSKLKEWFA